MPHSILPPHFIHVYLATGMRRFSRGFAFFRNKQLDQLYFIVENILSNRREEFHQKVAKFDQSYLCSRLYGMLLFSPRPPSLTKAKGS